MSYENGARAQSMALETQQNTNKSIPNVLSAMTLPVGRYAPGSRDNAPARCLSTFPVTQCSLSSQTKKYADVIIPRGADNEGKHPGPAALPWQPALGYCCHSGVRLEVAGPATEGTQVTAT